MELGFQSIGVTKDWRLTIYFVNETNLILFPINRRHQGLATVSTGSTTISWRTGFQSIGVTKDWRPAQDLRSAWRVILFQSIGVTKDWRPRYVPEHGKHDQDPFPINRRHQGLATNNP